MKSVKIKLDITELANILYENLSDDDIMYLIKEWDDMACSWDFTHKGYTYFKSIVDGNKKEYEEFVEDMIMTGENDDVNFECLIDDLEDI